MVRIYLALLGAVLGLSLAANADVTLPSLLSDNMVVQQKSPVHVWGRADPGEPVTVTFAAQAAKTIAGANGAWDLRLKPMAAGGPYTLTVTGKNTLTLKNVLVGEVWVCSGQSNMSFPLAAASNGPAAMVAAANPHIRLFHVPLVQSDTPQGDVKASWVQADPNTVGGFSAVGYFFGRDLQKALGVPVGLIQSDVGGTPGQFWTPAEALRADPFLQKTYIGGYRAQYARYLTATADWEVAAKAAREAGKPAPYKPDAPWGCSVLYNGMIAPLTHYPVRGAIWYQGESNTDDPAAYRKLLPALIQSWRAAWANPVFPFLIVQIAPFGAGSDNARYAEVREAQWETAQTTPRTGVAVTTDVGDEKDLHPKQKEPVGARLALLARKIAYGEKIVAQGPTLQTATRNGQTVTLRFAHIGGGLAAQGGLSSGVAVPEGRLVGFTLAGADGKSVAADARITAKDTVVVSSPQVGWPVAVAYGFANFPVVNLWNKNGLPAMPFRAPIK